MGLMEILRGHLHDGNALGAHSHVCLQGRESQHTYPIRRTGSARTRSLLSDSSTSKILRIRASGCCEISRYTCLEPYCSRIKKSACVEIR
ncbi:hypothetical protein TSAR_003345 [Trichomalopsis sarcophagae]|uniref:Uncharacterized protein n=1 Tax=Trichomalopsis sarcophagae TaxID=543379 RepID=A0A232FDA3_9HYME|nr:hypothetical protein TSAR_003345 [Trichomalopsis sarcophagae]